MSCHRDSSHNSRAGHPGWLRCSSLTYSRYARSSRLAIRAPRSGTYATNHGDRTLAARGESPPAFGRRCIPTPTPTRCETRVGDPGLTALFPPSNEDDKSVSVVAPNRRGPHGADCAPWGGSAGRLAALGATPDFHHGLLAQSNQPPQLQPHVVAVPELRIPSIEVADQP